jgi:UDP-galactopyranose mutase
MERIPALIVFSHLRWNWVWQRPQHVLSRLARRHRILFIEEPLSVEEGREAYWECREPTPGVLVCTPFTPVQDWGFNDRQLPELSRLMDVLIEREQPREFLVWLYTPMALPLARRLKPLAMIYDVMDELSAFKGAPPELLEHEAEAYRAVDVVFTGGPSLYRAKAGRHPNVHCFPSSVDSAHFGKARDAALDHAEQAVRPRPRFGFFGVIDERIDLALLEAMARARPDWQIMMVGPVTKIDPAQLPRHANLHYLGQRSYEELPAFLAGWDVCLLPFARNESTRFISPTKTLEYMAAEKPIVSTPIADVAEPYGDIVYLGDTADAFIAACDRALNEAPDEFGRRLSGMRKVLRRTSWDATARAMANEIGRVLRERNRVAGGTAPGAKRARKERKERKDIAIIGAGPTGLSAAYHAPDSVLLEANDTIGGWCRSIEENGFTFDFAGHIMFSNDAYVHELYDTLLGDNVHWQDREAWIYSKGVHTRYPFQGGLYGLPPEVIQECVVGAIEARFGGLRPPPSVEGNGPAKGNGSAQPGAKNNGRIPAVGRDGACTLGDVKDCCGDGVLESTARLAAPSTHKSGGSEPYAHFEEFIHKVWGAGIARHFAIPYNRKLWAVDLKEMETSWLGGRVPLPDLEEMIEGALKPVPKPMGPNARFGYPLRGGFQALMNGFLPHLRHRLKLNAKVVAISPRKHTVTLADGTSIEYGHLISTMPLPLLVKSLGEEAPAQVRQAAEGLRYVSVRCVNIGVGRPALTEKHWIYYPEDTVFHRIFAQGNASPHCNPSGGFGLTCEITYAPGKPLPCDGDALIERCIRDCHAVGLFGPDDPIWAANQVDMPHAYVIYDHARAANVKFIRDWLAERDIILAGRYGEWEYYNSDHAFLAGKRAVETARELRRKRAKAAAAKTAVSVRQAEPGGALAAGSITVQRVQELGPKG